VKKGCKTCDFSLVELEQSKKTADDVRMGDTILLVVHLSGCIHMVML